LTLFVKIVYLVGDLSAGNECRAAAMGKMAPWFAGFGLAILSQTLVSWAFGFTSLCFHGPLISRALFSQNLISEDLVRWSRGCLRCTAGFDWRFGSGRSVVRFGNILIQQYLDKAIFRFDDISV
jgi:hypothetical protein